MKVSLAAQTLSSSVADALEFLECENVFGFRDVSATVGFIRCVDQIFDFLNSKSLFSKGFKSPLFFTHIDNFERKMNQFIDYLFSLKHEGTLLVKSKRRLFIIGFTACIKSVIAIAKELQQQTVVNFSYILTYKFSQDYLELLFCKIRQMFGCNNNPNCLQF